MRLNDRISRIQQRFDEFWLAEESVANLIVARVLLASTALWVVLSRPGLPSVLLFPKELWRTVPFERRLRFLLIAPFGVEQLLWILLHIALIASLMGWLRRWSCLVAGLLLFHFAPLETIIWTPNPYLRGLTIPCLGLLLFAFADSRFARASGHVPAWPLRLTQSLFCLVYFFAGYAKLFWSGIAWTRASNMRLYLLGLDQFLDLHTVMARLVAESGALCTGIAISGLAFELLFPVVLFVRWTRWVFIPAAILFHVANSVLFHVFFHDIGILLIFVNWHWIIDRRWGLARPVPWPQRSFET